MLGETVTRIRAAASTGDDRYGDPIPGAPAETSIDGALFAPGGTQEPAEPGRSPVVADPALYFPRAWPDITATDRLRVRDQVYEVVGDPRDWLYPGTSNVAGLVVQLRKVTG